MTMGLEQFRIMNAAGWIKADGASFQKLLRSAVTEITIGSITHEKRLGNTGTNFHVLPDGTGVNSLGLPNGGLTETHRALVSMIDAIRDRKKKVRLSIAPLQLSDLNHLAQLGKCHGVDTLELNLGCPNVHDGGNHHAIFAYDIDLTRAAIEEVLRVWKKGELAVKLSPYEDLSFLREMTGLMNELLRPGDSVVLSNTEPNFCPRNEEGQPYLRAITPEGHEINTGGKSGTQLVGRNHRNIRLCRRDLRSDLTITAAMGIRDGATVASYEEEGATVFQVGTAYFATDDPKIFGEIGADYLATIPNTASVK